MTCRAQPRSTGARILSGRTYWTNVLSRSAPPVWHHLDRGMPVARAGPDHCGVSDGRVGADTMDTRDLARTTLGVGFLAAMIVGTLWVLRPFLAAAIWAVTIVVATWPIMLAVQARLCGRRAGAGGGEAGGLLPRLPVP